MNMPPRPTLACLDMALASPPPPTAEPLARLRAATSHRPMQWASAGAARALHLKNTTQDQP